MLTSDLNAVEFWLHKINYNENTQSLQGFAIILILLIIMCLLAAINEKLRK